MGIKNLAGLRRREDLYINHAVCAGKEKNNKKPIPSIDHGKKSEGLISGSIGHCLCTHH